MSVDLNKLLSEIVAFRSYAKFLPDLNRRETVEETIERNLQMHLDRFPKLTDDIVAAFQLVKEKKILPSMRTFQFAGEAILKNNIRSYNCAFLNIDDIRAFGETLYVLLSGTGVGYSVQGRHVNRLPTIQAPRESVPFIVHDSIEGWAQAVDALCEAYFLRRVKPDFDFFLIRPKDAYLKTTGSKAPGPEPLKNMLLKVEKVLKAAIGRQLRPIEVHDIICFIAEGVRAGGVRKAALLALFDRDDPEMLTCKTGNWLETNPQRSRANNSAVLPRTISQEEFFHIFNMTWASGYGEPGFFWSNNLDWGCNPCNEIGLRSKQFCNLTTINQGNIVDAADLMKRARGAAFLGTLQAAYTDFPYLTPQWKETTEMEALLGVSFTGIADTYHTITDANLRDAAYEVLETNLRVADKLGINPAARTTAIKPEGTSSAYLGTSSGIGARHARGRYLRRVRIPTSEALVSYLSEVMPGLMEVDKYDPDTMVLTIPQVAPTTSICRDDETAQDQLNRVLRYHRNWILEGHRRGDNTHNVSCTINVRDGEWESLRQAMWDTRDSYAGISLLPYDNGKYVQAPFEEVTEQQWNEYVSQVKPIDLRAVREDYVTTDRNSMPACAGGACEIP